MLNTINSDLIRGHINTIILKALFEGDRYGYDIIKEIEQKSSGQYQLKQPTLYSCLKRLEVQGFIRSYWGAKSVGGRRKYFTLTDMGREVFIKNQAEWEYSRTVIDKLISDREYDLSQVNASPQLSDEETITEEFDDEPVTDEVVEETEAEQSETEQTETYTQDEAVDTRSLLNDLFENQNVGESYLENVISEEYKEGYVARSDEYFRDYDSQDQEEDIAQEAFEEETDAQENEAFEQEPPQDAATANNFSPYDSERNGHDDNSSILWRDYKKDLGRIFYGTLGTETAESHVEQAPPMQADTTPKETYAQPAPPPPVPDEEQPAMRFYSSDNLNRDLNDISDAALNGTGDTVRTRVHDAAASSKYNKQYHYYCNKLMLVHYAILFGIMMFEIALTFIIAKVGLGLKSDSLSIATYIISIVVALSFPIIAAIKNFTDPMKTKRFDFDLRNSLIFRIWVTACCLVIIYCFNVILQMPISFDKEYLPSLLLPTLMVLDFPISSLVFMLLYNTGRYSQTN